MSVEAVDEGLNTWFIDVANIGRSLARFLSHHYGVGIN